MKFPPAAFTIRQQALHTTSGLIGTIEGIRRNGDALQYLFDCEAFKQWLGIAKLEPIKESSQDVTIQSLDDDGEVEYKLFDIVLMDSRKNEHHAVRVYLTLEIKYQQSFPSINKAKALYDFLQAQDSLSEPMLAAVGMERVQNEQAS